MFCHGDILSVGFSLKPSSLGTLLLHKIHSSLVGMALEQYCVIPNVTLHYSLLLTFACLQRIEFFILFATLLCLRRHVCNYLENDYVKPIQ